MEKDKDLENNNTEDVEKCDCERLNDNETIDAEDINTNDQEKIESLEGEVKSLKDTLLRKMAEFDNLRKRLEKERDDSEKYANSRFAKDLIGVVDNFDRVAENYQSISEKIAEDATLKAFLDGVLLCGKELVSIFKKHGISQIEVSEGDAFNPQYHQAMCEIESSDHKPGSVIKVFQIGYVYHGRLLRPSMVSVSKK